MNILIINWRSLKDSNAGGAERVTFEHAKHWIADHGAAVSWLAPPYSELTSETIEGVMFDYIGWPLKKSTLNLLISYPIFYLSVFWRYLSFYRYRTDVIIEGVHGVPFLSRFYASKPVIIYLQEVAGPIWDKMFGFPINILGKTIERIFLRLYKRNRFVVGSDSTKIDLIKVGIPENVISIVNHGSNLETISKLPEKTPYYSVLFLNRLVRMKGPERALKCFAKILSKRSDAVLNMVGAYDESYLKKLKDLCNDLEISHKVKFNGYVSEEKKLSLLRSSHVLLNTSYKEGWGLCNIEANSQGTPVIAFDVEGNRDSVSNGISGYLVPDGDVDAMAEEALSVENDEQIMKSSIEFSKRFSWKAQASLFYSIIKSTRV